MEVKYQVGIKGGDRGGRMIRSGQSVRYVEMDSQVGIGLGNVEEDY